MVTAGTVSGRRRGQDCVAAESEGLLPRLCHAAKDNVLHRYRIDARALDDRIERLFGHIRGMPTGQLAIAPASSRAHGLDDVSFSHFTIPHEFRAVRLARKAAPSRISSEFSIGAMERGRSRIAPRCSSGSCSVAKYEIEMLDQTRSSEFEAQLRYLGKRFERRTQTLRHAARSRRPF
jgi:hypothetical protein